MQRIDNDPPTRLLIDINMLSAAVRARPTTNTTATEAAQMTAAEDSDSDEMPPLHRLEVLKRSTRELFKKQDTGMRQAAYLRMLTPQSTERTDWKRHAADTMEAALNGYEYYHGWPKGAAQPEDVTASSAGMLEYARSMRRWLFKGRGWCKDCKLPDHCCGCTTDTPVAFPCKINFDLQQTTLDNYFGCLPESTWPVTSELHTELAELTSELHTELVELTRDADNWMKRASTSPNRDPCMSPMLIRKSKRMRKVPLTYKPEETSADDDFTDSNETAVSSSPESDLEKLNIMPTLAVL